MAKHATQFAVMVRATLMANEIMVGMPFVDKEAAEAEADIQWMAGNYSARAVEYNPNTGQVIEPDYNDFPPLS